MIFYLLINVQSGLSQSIYFEDPETVPLFEATITTNTQKNIYWDLSEISGVRLDLAGGVTQTGFNPPHFYYFTNGNWYKNENNSNFNSEVIENRFIYQDTSLNFNGINGLLFAKLNSNPETKKEIVVTREDNKIYIFQNNGSIVHDNPFKFIVNGKVTAVGKFTNDTLEDVAVISGIDLKIYKNLGNSTLDTTPVYTLHNVNAERVIISQVSNYKYPYSIINNTTGDRDEIIIKSGNTIRIYKNNNSNGISDSTIINITGGFASDFKLSDINNDGLNDLEVVSTGGGIKIFENIYGVISSSAFYSNTNYSTISTVALGDFNKDGWNDLLISNYDHIYLFLNEYGSFPQTASDDEEYYSNDYYFYGTKLEIADLQNKGGLTVLSSLAYLNIDHFDEEALFDNNASIQRFNTTDTDAVPAPPIIFKSYVYKNGKTWPKLYLYNRGDRDFNKFRIYKKSPNRHDSTVFVAETSYNTYLDTTENIVVGETEPDSTNCLYFATCTDHTSHESINSDTVKYYAQQELQCEMCCENCDALSSNTNTTDDQQSRDISIKNYPNPFNPVTYLEFGIPDLGFVSLKVYDMLGKEIMTLVNEMKDPGRYTVEFNGSKLSSGVYYYKLRSGNHEVIRKMVLLK